MNGPVGNASRVELDPTHLPQMIAVWREVCTRSDTPSVVLAKDDLLALLDRLDRAERQAICGATTEVTLFGCIFIYRCHHKPGHGGEFHEGPPMGDSGQGIGRWPAAREADAPTGLAPSTPRSNESAGSVGKSEAGEE